MNPGFLWLIQRNLTNWNTLRKYKHKIGKTGKKMKVIFSIENALVIVLTLLYVVGIWANG